MMPTAGQFAKGAFREVGNLQNTFIDFAGNNAPVATTRDGRLVTAGPNGGYVPHFGPTAGQHTTIAEEMKQYADEATRAANESIFGNALAPRVDPYAAIPQPQWVPGDSPVTLPNGASYSQALADELAYGAAQQNAADPSFTKISEGGGKFGGQGPIRENKSPGPAGVLF